MYYNTKIGMQNKKREKCSEKSEIYSITYNNINIAY